MYINGLTGVEEETKINTPTIIMMITGGSIHQTLFFQI
jgi:hypothetical protein